MSDGNTIITDIGQTKIGAAAATGTEVAITHVALGDGDGSNYAPGYGQSTLKGERIRRPIARNHIAGDKSWRITAEFLASETPIFWVREIGFFDNGGDLIFLWAGADLDSRRAGAIDYLVEHRLVLDRVADGVVIVDAPSDTLFDLAVSTATALAQSQLEQLRQADRIAALESST